ncbi:ATP-binding cassette domain-containing protein [Devosia sp.]|uniref:ATP-binding cassette domain-containing protein n=1 Tax=Devosia sp. TaxID=1871048 RepID=UPI0035AE0E61
MLIADRLLYAHTVPAGRTYEFSFAARRGEVTAVSGPSGSGKSTLLDLISGFLAPSGGTLALDGRDLLPLAPEQRPVSILFQTETLFEHLTAARNVELGLPRHLPPATRRERVADALAEVGLPAVMGQRAATLSGGEKQRVALARTLLRGRPILLLDEPFSALDDDTRGTVRRLVGDLTRRHGWITMLVSHHADDVATLAARRYTLADGRLSGPLPEPTSPGAHDAAEGD